LADGVRRLFWPMDLEEIPYPPQEAWWRRMFGQQSSREDLT
jgi:hypothetical protein